GVPVLERRGRNVMLTDAGEVLVTHGREVLASLERTEAAVAELHGEPVGRVRIGALPSATASLLPPALQRLRAIHPRVEPEVVVHPLDENIRELRLGSLDVAVDQSYEFAPHGLFDGMDVTVLLDVEPEVGSRRRGGAGRDRIERAGEAFHRRVAEAYRLLAEGEDRIARVDGSDAPAAVHDRVLAVLGAAVLAAIALPAYQDYAVRARAAQVAAEAEALTRRAGEYITRHRRCPGNATAGFGPANDYATTLVAAVRFGEYPGGACAIELRFRDLDNAADGRTLVFQAHPSQSPLTWACHGGTLPSRFLPAACR
ncbi:MAG: pilin, partial [Proteobacteria bacterium]|nr:pilin [Pseudomonadota bacterium]